MEGHNEDRGKVLSCLEKRSKRMRSFLRSMAHADQKGNLNGHY